MKLLLLIHLLEDFINAAQVGFPNCYEAVDHSGSQMFPDQQPQFQGDLIAMPKGKIALKNEPERINLCLIFGDHTHCYYQEVDGEGNLYVCSCFCHGYLEDKRGARLPDA